MYPGIYNPVASWIREVDLALTDESQQYGNIEETSAIARTDEAKLFRQKLMKRPLVLRCGTDYVQPHELCKAVRRYLDGPIASPSHSGLLEHHGSPDGSPHFASMAQVWGELLGEGRPWLVTSVCVSVACRGAGTTVSVADSLQCASRLSGRQRWGLILPSSARVSHLTYQTVIQVRYPELVKRNNGGWQFGG